MQKPRFILFDALKVILALLVINVHYEAIITLKPYSLLFYLGWYAVPLFVASSFYFNSKYFLDKNLDIATFWQKTKRFLFPLLFWSVIAFLIYPKFINPTNILNQLFSGNIVDTPLYYLNIMIALSVFWYIVPRKVITALMFSVLLIEALGLNIPIINALPQPLQYFPTRFIEFFKYAAIGSLIPAIIPKLKKIPHINRILASILIITLPTDILWFWYHQNDTILYSGNLQFLSVTLLISLLALNQELVLSNALNRIVKLFSTYILGVYCMHFFFVDNLRRILQNYKMNYQEAQIPFVILIFFISYFLSFLIDKVSFNRLKNTVS